MKDLIQKTVILSVLAYKNKKEVLAGVIDAELKDFIWIENTETDVQCFLCSDDEHQYLTFRGSSTDADWATNFDIKMVPCRFGWVHRGFQKDCVSVYLEIIQALDHSKELIINGHSQGAGMSCVMGIALLEVKRSLYKVIHFGGPRVVDNVAARYLDENYPGIFHRVVNNNDVVTRIAPRIFKYQHFGRFHYFKGDGKYTNAISMWGYFLDRLKYKLDFGGEYGIDIFNDHVQEDYLKVVGEWKV